MAEWYIMRGDQFSYSIEQVPPENRALASLVGGGTYPSKEAALNAYINELIENRKALDAVLKSAQKKQRRWDQRNEGRNPR